MVKLVKRQTWQQHEAERAAIVREATRPMSPPRAKASSARNPPGSTTAASQAGPSRRLPSPAPGHPIATSSPVGSRFVGTIPKIRQASNNSYQAVQEDRSRTRAKCGFTGGRARSNSRHSNSSRSSTPHQPHQGQIQHGSAGPRDRLGNRVSHPPQQQHSRRLGAGQPARPQGYRSRVDGHNRSLVDQDSTYDWELDEQWEDEEER